jgi:hypothetical protein
MIYKNVSLYILHFISGVERNFGFDFGCGFGFIKIFILKKLLLGFIDNDVTNIVCARLDKKGKCDKAIHKLGLCSWNIFCISPRALVFCVLNNNKDMLKYVRSLGYPLEMITYADNYHLVQKRRLENYIHNID